MGRARTGRIGKKKKETLKPLRYLTFKREQIRGRRLEPRIIAERRSQRGGKSCQSHREKKNSRRKRDKLPTKRVAQNIDKNKRITASASRGGYGGLTFRG